MLEVFHENQKEVRIRHNTSLFCNVFYRHPLMFTRESLTVQGYLTGHFILFVLIYYRQNLTI